MLHEYITYTAKVKRKVDEAQHQVHCAKALLVKMIQDADIRDKNNLLILQTMLLKIGLRVYRIMSFDVTIDSQERAEDDWGIEIKNDTTQTRNIVLSNYQNNISN